MLLLMLRYNGHRSILSIKGKISEFNSSLSFNKFDPGKISFGNEKTGSQKSFKIYLEGLSRNSIVFCKST